ncbi:MAG: CPBP family intramembrane metalloprotease [Candidatus Methanoplasma sp.]|jgi:hypothetical protein|nr:CPBP family intramembrane metalloprotease [Candidatus Methanoplasma sp.]
MTDPGVDPTSELSVDDIQSGRTDFHSVEPDVIADDLGPSTYEGRPDNDHGIDESGTPSEPVPEQKKGALYPFIDFEQRPLVSLTFLASIFVIAVFVVELLYLGHQIPIIINLLTVSEFLPVAFQLVYPIIDLSPHYISYDVLFNQVYWALIVTVITASVVYLIFRFTKDAILSRKENSLKTLENNGLFWVCILFCTITTADLIYSVITTTVWHFPNNPFGLEIDVDYVLSHIESILVFPRVIAPVWEELVVRVIYIGVPITVVSLIITKKIRSLRHLLGGFGASKFAMILIVFSSIVFGLAHEPSWGLWMVFPAAYIGLALGYLYMRFGLHAAIALHFLFNLRDVFELVWPETPFFDVVNYALAILGIFTTLYIISKLRENKSVIKTLPWFSSVKDDAPSVADNGEEPTD